MKISRVYHSILIFHVKVKKHYNQLKYVFECTFRQHDEDRENKIIDYNNQQLDNLRLQPDFKYYQNYEFYKLRQSLIKNKMLSILYTNICSLEGNAEKLETLISNLEFNFDVIAVSETWTSYPRKKLNQELLMDTKHTMELKGIL